MPEFSTIAAVLRTAVNMEHMEEAKKILEKVGKMNENSIFRCVKFTDPEGRRYNEGELLGCLQRGEAINFQAEKKQLYSSIWETDGVCSTLDSLADLCDWWRTTGKAVYKNS